MRKMEEIRVKEREADGKRRQSKEEKQRDKSVKGGGKEKD